MVDAGCRESLHRRTNGVGDPARASQPFPVSRRSTRRPARRLRYHLHRPVGPRTTRAPYGPRLELADGRAPRHGIRSPGAAHGAPAAVAHARRRRRRAGSTRRARARRLTPVRSPGPAGRCDPWGAIARRRILTWGQALAPASRTFHSALNPAGTRCRQCRIISPPRSPCGRRRTGYGSIVTAWSRGTVISIGPGADGMLWDRGRTTGQAGPV